MAAGDPEHWATVDASRSEAVVGRAIRTIVQERLGV
jgi:hypothetical protein